MKNTYIKGKYYDFNGKAKAVIDYKNNFIQQVAQYGNEKLMQETFFLSGGDDYDGCFTDRGEWEFDVLTKELSRRLQEVGFIKNDWWGNQS